ncbi:hypothetical protein [Pseudomonas asiatica]|uniref:hypothetical protein n=1 Tax=Pseudomonas asiatica TaxID=2219225 RepID=UPI003B93A2AB
MKERPILFSGPMVRAILSGQKTVTRRAMKHQPQKAPVDVVDGVPSWDSPTNYAGEVQMNTQRGKPCPYGKPGDRLWVREAWAQINVAQAPGDSWVVYRECDNRTDYGGPWKPSIHMRRRDSRILLEVTDVRVERLQDITEDQARGEGITDGGCTNCGHNEPCGCDCPSPSAVDSFVYLWQQINGPKAWDANPWVWVIEFKRVEP